LRLFLLLNIKEILKSEASWVKKQGKLVFALANPKLQVLNIISPNI